MTRNRLHWLTAAREDGQSTVEYTLIIALISVPLGILVLTLVRLLIRVVLTAILQDFTGGPEWT